MGQISGDKSRFNRQRRKKLARRVEMRALRASWTEKGSAAPESSAAKKKVSKAEESAAPE